MHQVVVLRGGPLVGKRTLAGALANAVLPAMLQVATGRALFCGSSKEYTSTPGFLGEVNALKECAAVVLVLDCQPERWGVNEEAAEALCADMLELDRLATPIVVFANKSDLREHPAPPSGLHGLLGPNVPFIAGSATKGTGLNGLAICLRTLATFHR